MYSKLYSLTAKRLLFYKTNGFESHMAKIIKTEVVIMCVCVCVVCVCDDGKCFYIYTYAAYNILYIKTFSVTHTHTHHI